MIYHLVARTGTDPVAGLLLFSVTQELLLLYLTIGPDIRVSISLGP